MHPARGFYLFFYNLSLQQKMRWAPPFGETYLIFFVGTILQQSLYVGALGGRLQSLDCSFPICFCPDYT